MSNWSKPYNDITWRNGNAPYLNAENLNENQSWIKELDSRTKELYARTDTAEPGGIARDVYYDNGTSGLDADNVQDAIDKIANRDITVIVLSAEDDLDNVIDPSKVYTFTSANCPAHSPDSTKNFYMEVMFDGGSGNPRRRQIAYEQGTFVKYERIKAYNGTWGAWVRCDAVLAKTITATTDGNGLVNLGMSKSKIYSWVIVNNAGSDGKYVLVPAASSDNYMRLVSATNGANVPNYSLTLNLMYRD